MSSVRAEGIGEVKNVTVDIIYDGLFIINSNSLFSIDFRFRSFSFFFYSINLSCCYEGAQRELVMAYVCVC